ncbi:MAG TPA: DUF6596 domain-containing protein [Gemmatimonadaceae bacterium]|nr:DUF6596 domain-containing protein [Gemmatimonadaceae bacterium]
MSTPIDIEHLLRELTPQVLGAVARKHGDFAAAEDAVQEALIAAASQWPERGVPANPRGWLYHVALRRITDHLRSEIARRERETTAGGELWAEWAFVPSPDDDIIVDGDDTLALLFMCCHPALTPASAIALTLRAVGGLSTAEIAAAFLVPEATMAQRISRAKGTIASSGVPFALPDPGERDARLDSALHVLYLIFNEGYSTSAGTAAVRADLSGEAIRLARLLRRLLPDDPEVLGLLALMLLTDARRAARTGSAGELIPLDEQDRSRWDRAMIEEGSSLVADTFARGTVGPYLVQAAIAAAHDRAPRADDTEWREILGLYDLLLRMVENPVVALNRAVAHAMVHGPEAGLAALAALDDDARIAGHYRMDVVRGHLYERLGDRARAAAHLRAAAERTANVPERDYLTLKAARLGAEST